MFLKCDQETCRGSNMNSQSCLQKNITNCFKVGSKFLKGHRKSEIEKYRQIFQDTKIFAKPEQDEVFLKIVFRSLETLQGLGEKLRKHKTICSFPELFSNSSNHGDNYDKCIINNTKPTLTQLLDEKSNHFVKKKSTTVQTVWIIYCVIIFTTYGFHIGRIYSMPIETSIRRRRRDSMYRSYKGFDKLQLIVIFIVIGSILYCEITMILRIEKLDQSQTSNYTFEWKIIQSHCIGLYILLTMYLIFILGNTIIHGKRYTAKIIEERKTKQLMGMQKALNAFLKALQKTYKLFSLRSGKYYFYKAIIFETLEMILHVANINEMVSTKEVNFVIVATIIISLNLILTPLAYYSIFRYEDNIARKTIYSLDTFLDLAYFVTIFYFITDDDLTKVLTFGAMIYPCMLIS
jgi:hypothetical protein